MMSPETPATSPHDLPPPLASRVAAARPANAASSRKPRKTKSCRLQVQHLGPIRQANIEFGDLTVIVGPQATGKSILLQTLKLLIDRDQIHDTFRHHSMHFQGKPAAFLEGFYGRGLSGAWSGRSSMHWDGKAVALPDLAKPTKSKRRHERVFYIPAQRVMSLPGGVSQNFGQFNFGDPYVLRAFSDAVHDLIQNEFGPKGDLFPASNRLNGTLRQPIDEHLFGGNKLVVDSSDYTKRLALAVPGQETPLGFLSWSAGQREFAPMLMGLYWLCTVTARRKSGETADETIDWVVIEEPEMGLHPQGIGAVLLLVLELLRRGYRVVLSSHSPVVLEMVWVLRELEKLGAPEEDVRKLFGINGSVAAKELAKSALQKDYRVYYFDRHAAVQDISSLDPGASDPSIAQWGGISGFSSRAHEVLADAVVRTETRAVRRKRQDAASAKGEA